MFGRNGGVERSGRQKLVWRRRVCDSNERARHRADRNGCFFRLFARRSFGFFPAFREAFLFTRFRIGGARGDVLFVLRLNDGRRVDWRRRDGGRRDAWKYVRFDRIGDRFGIGRQGRLTWRRRSWRAWRISGRRKIVVRGRLRKRRTCGARFASDLFQNFRHDVVAFSSGWRRRGALRGRVLRFSRLTNERANKIGCVVSRTRL